MGAITRDRHFILDFDLNLALDAIAIHDIRDGLAVGRFLKRGKEIFAINHDVFRQVDRRRNRDAYLLFDGSICQYVALQLFAQAA
ncbi:hypothetical protein [Bradyrhizobium sp. SZCCHNS2005]|uniref:hypothetical protein n=1 Tax=Bradyrhizobium sp. SZCCHNS2005 TaxID=3057303 RepID=UPI0028E7B8E6|nr:hypothetical protein [Bradyrhizobium sp. SZCCHNS2005]